MTFQRDSFQPALRVTSITFCSCVLCGTELEQIPAKREVIMLWAKDAVAGVGLVGFMVTAFLVASGAHGLLKLL